MHQLFSGRAALTIPGMLLLAASAGMVNGQSLSHDGKRWYEVEISIFTNPVNGYLYPESFEPDNTSLSYPRNIRMLEPAAHSLQLAETSRTAQPPVDQQAGQARDEGQLPLPVARFYGPARFSGTTSARIAITESDPFISLGENTATFTRHNARLRNSGKHRLLYHAVWRQPVMPLDQAIPIAIAGGSLYYPHQELEGWLRLSYNINRIDVETELWLMQFEAANNNAADKRDRASLTASGDLHPDPLAWQVPMSPAELERQLEASRNTIIDTHVTAPGNAEGGTIASTGLHTQLQTNEILPRQEYQVSRLWRLGETRPVISNNLHYLDHPRLGMLVELRPYQLPIPESSAQGDF